MKAFVSALLGANIILAAGTFAAAHAADIYQGGGGTTDEPAYMPAITWTGFYLGAHFGGSFGDGIELNSGDGNPSFSIRNAALAGLHIGYNWHATNNIVLGAEGDYTLGGGGDEVGGAFGTDGIASIRGRLGYALGPTMVYATGGVAVLNWSELQYQLGFDDSVAGWVAGAGVEHKIMRNVSLGLEGLYYAFDDERTVPFTLVYDRDFWAIRARLNYHFASGHEEPLK